MTLLGPSMLLVAVPLIVVALGIVVVVVWVIVQASRNPTRQRQDAPAQDQAPYQPVQGRANEGASAQPGLSGAWNAHLRREGHLDPLSGFGSLVIVGGLLIFTPDGAATAAWSVPAVSFGVWSNSALANSDLGIDSQPTGRLLLTVSHEHINRASYNNFKRLREREAAAEFVQAMRAAGATILG